MKERTKQKHCAARPESFGPPCFIESPTSKTLTPQLWEIRDQSWRGKATSKAPVDFLALLSSSKSVWDHVESAVLLGGWTKQCAVHSTTDLHLCFVLKIANESNHKTRPHDPFRPARWQGPCAYLSGFPKLIRETKRSAVDSLDRSQLVFPWTAANVRPVCSREVKL